MLFGHQDDAKQAVAQAATPSSDATQDTSSGTNPLAVDPATGVSLPVAPADTMTSLEGHPDELSVLDQPPTAELSSQQTQPSFVSDPTPTTPFGVDQGTQTNAQALDTLSAVDNTPSAPVPPVFDSGPTPQSTAQAAPTQSLDDSAQNNQTTPTDDGLLDIKRQALSQLGPLVSQLNQTPEERFRTTMMLIQSTDDSSLLKDAYEAAQTITDDKARAQAFLDVVNEINYFTQQSAETH